MQKIYVKIPHTAVFPMFDGSLYANVPHRFDGESGIVRTDGDSRLMRFAPPSFFEGDVAYLYLGRAGDGIRLVALSSDVVVLCQPEFVTVGQRVATAHGLGTIVGFEDYAAEECNVVRLPPGHRILDDRSVRVVIDLDAGHSWRGDGTDYCVWFSEFGSVVRIID